MSLIKDAQQKGMKPAPRTRFRRADEALWLSANPTLEYGEPGYVRDTGEVVVGDGETAFASLRRFVPFDPDSELPSDIQEQVRILLVNEAENPNSDFGSILEDLRDTDADLDAANNETSAKVDRVAKASARIKNLSGYNADAGKCPVAKATVSVLNTAFDGYDFAGPIYKVQQIPSFAEVNWVPSDLYLVASTNWYTMHSGPWNVGASDGTGTITKPYDFTTIVEGSYYSVGFGFISGIWTQDIRIWIDDQEISDWYLGSRASGALQGKSRINTTSLGLGTHIVNINFATRGAYKVRVAGLICSLGGASAGAATVGNMVTVNANTRLLKPSEMTKIGVISDSWFEPIVRQTTLSIATEIGFQLNANVFNFAQGGSGFVNPSGGGAQGDKSYPSAVVRDALDRHPHLDLIIVNGSSNDLGYTESQVEAAMHATFDMIRDYDPNIPIVWVGLEPQSWFKAIYGLPAMKARETFQAGIAAADPNVVAVVRTCNEEWLTGTGKVGGTTGNGNQDFATGADGVHLSAYGTEFYGKVLSERIKAALAAI